MREHAPNSTRIAGVSIALLMTATVGYALANGFIGQVAKFIEPPLVFTPLEENPAPVDQPKRDLPIAVDGPAIPVLDIPKDIFVPYDETKTYADDKPVDVGLVRGTDVAATPVRTRPALITRTPPPYPAADIRKQNEGVTGIKVCLDATGRVTSANLGSSSGHMTLDNAALKWVRDARFTPAKMDGVAQSVCGHDVFYEWKLENAH